MLHGKNGVELHKYDLVAYGNFEYIVYLTGGGNYYLFNDNELLKIKDVDTSEIELIEHFAGEWL